MSIYINSYVWINKIKHSLTPRINMISILSLPLPSFEFFFSPQLESRKQHKIYFFEKIALLLFRLSKAPTQREEKRPAVYAIERKYKQTRFIVCFYGFTLIEIFFSSFSLNKMPNAVL